MSFINSSKKLARAATGEGSDFPNDSFILPVQLLPDQAAAFYQQVGVRLKVSGVFLPLTSYDESASAREAGITVSVQLARIEDKELLAPGAEFLIETFCADGDEEIVWETVLSGRINSRTLSVANADGKPADTLQVTFSSIDKLSKSPARNLVIYDSVRADLDAAEFEPVYDTSGREYTLESLAVSDLSLHKLLDLICVDRCGFNEVITNLPDYPIRRADFSIFENYYDGLKPFIGVFDGRDYQGADGKFYLFDISLDLPTGSMPGILPAAKIQTISSSSNLEKISAFELQFSQSETGEFYTIRNKTFETSVTTRFGDTISRTSRKVKYRQYRSNYARRIVLREVVEREVVEIYGADSVFPVAVNTEEFEFDYLGRQKQSVKTVEKSVPDLTGSVSLRTLQTDELNHIYGVFPFAPRRQFLKRTELSSDGLIAVDSDNQYFGTDYPQGYATAHRNGDLKTDGMTETSGLLKSITEDFTPLPDGTVEVRTTEIDHTPEAVGRDAIVTTAGGEPRAGDVSVSGSGRAARIYVLADGVTDLGDKRVEPFAVGELPLYHAVPLANRRLKRQGKQKLSVSLVGWNKSINQGTVLIAETRDESAKIITTGYRRFARIENNSLNWGMSIEGEEI